jgi:hypothetical protein
MHSLPVELQERILGSFSRGVDQDRDALRSCSLVCSEWKPLAQPLLFRGAVLKLEEVPWQDEEAMCSLKPVLSLLDDLQVRSVAFVQKAVPGANSNSCDLVDMEIMIPDDYDPQRVLFTPWIPRLFLSTRVTFRHCSFGTLVVLRNVLAGLPYLKHLLMPQEDGFIRVFDTNAVPLYGGLRLMSLHVELVDEVVGCVLLEWTTTSEPVRLEALTVNMHGERMRDAVRRLLHACAATVRIVRATLPDHYTVNYNHTDCLSRSLQ